MNGYIMNYIQSFKPNGLANANGTIKVISHIDSTPMVLYCYNFESLKWELWSGHPNGNSDGVIPLDENGVSNRLWKIDSGSGSYAKIIVRDSKRNELFNYISQSNWNDTAFRETLDLFNRTVNDFIGSAKAKIIKASQQTEDKIDLDIMGLRNYVIVLNDTSSEKEFSVTPIYKNTAVEIILKPQLMLVGYINSENKFIEL